MGITTRQQRVFDKNQSVDKSMKEAVVLQEKTFLTKTAERLSALKSGKWKEYKNKTKRTVNELVRGEKTYLPKKK